MTIKTFHFFKTGTHKTMAAEDLTFTRADLKRSADGYMAQSHPAPLVPNHPQDNFPILGMVKSLTAKGDNLYATAEFSEGLVKDVKAKRFKGVSAKWFRPSDPRNPAPGRWYLRHIGFLDERNPAVKGLKPVAFAESWWDGSMVTSTVELEVAFSEPSDEDDEERERHVLHATAQLLMKRNTALDYRSAALVAHRKIQDFKTWREQSKHMDPDRVAFHEAALDYQEAIPGVTYAQAAHYVLSLF